jgi:type III secretion protein V
MDGAMKFVKGDAIAGIIVAFVNIVGGLAIGVGQRGMSAGDALQRFGLLTIGEGLVAQIPALIVSTAAGILVTRVASEEPDQSLGREIATQIVGQPRALGIASVLLGLFAITPGMPAVPFLVISVGLGLAARAVTRAQARKARASEVIGARTGGAGTPARVGESEREREAYKPVMTPISVEVGEGLAPLVEGTAAQPEAPLRALIPAMREGLFHELGVPFPGVRVRVLRGELAPQTAVIRVHEVPVFERELPPGRRLADANVSTLAERGIDAIADTHPATDAPSAWVEEAAAASLEREGIPALGHDEVLVAALGDALRRSAAQFVGIQEAQTMLDALEQSHPALVRNLVPKPITVTLLAEVLRRMAEEGVSIRNLRDILEGLAPYAAQEKDPVVLADLARQSLRRHVTYALASRGRLYAWFLSHEVTEAIRESIVRTPSGNYLRLDPRLGEEIREAAALRIGTEGGVLLADPDIRRYVWVLLEPRLPRLRVISHAELTSGTLVEPLGMIGP